MTAATLPAPLPMRIKLAHGLGSVTLGIKEAGLTTFFMLYYNQVLGFDPRTVSLVLIGAMVIDALVDPLIGRLSDATRTRFGRRLPWLYGAAVPMAIAWALLWVSHDIAQHSTLGLIVNVVAVRILVSACEIPSVSLVAELTRDYDERTTLMRFRFLFGWLGGLTATALAYGYFLTSDEPGQSGLLEAAGYTEFGLFGAAMILVTTLGSALGQHRRIVSLPPPPAAGHGNSIFADIALAFRNPAFVALASGALFIVTGYATAIASINYMMLYVWQLGDAQFAWYPLGLAIAVFGAFAAVGRAHRRRAVQRRARLPALCRAQPGLLARARWHGVGHSAARLHDAVAVRADSGEHLRRVDGRRDRRGARGRSWHANRGRVFRGLSDDAEIRTGARHLPRRPARRLCGAGRADAARGPARRHGDPDGMDLRRADGGDRGARRGRAASLRD